MATKIKNEVSERQRKAAKKAHKTMLKEYGKGYMTKFANKAHDTMFRERGEGYMTEIAKKAWETRRRKEKLKEELLEMARNGEPRPNRRSKIGKIMAQ